MNSEKGREIHGKAEEAREKEQNFVKALQLLDEATVVYDEDKDYFGMSEAQSSRYLVLRHLFQKTNDDTYLILALHAAQSAVDIAEKHAIKEALCLAYFNLGKCYEDKKDYQTASKMYEKTIENIESLSSMHNRQAVKADMYVHKGFVQAMCGDTAGIKVVEDALHELENADEGKYTKDVWMSGGYMKLAEALKESDREKAVEELERAKEIIFANPELVLRKAQWEKLSESFK